MSSLLAPLDWSAVPGNIWPGAMQPGRAGEFSASQSPQFTFGDPYTGWATGTPYVAWATGEPYTGWNLGTPYAD